MKEWEGKPKETRKGTTMITRDEVTMTYINLMNHE